jgi:hypothetical protein
VSHGPGLLERALDRVSGRGETPLVLCIDVEPDTRIFDRADPPPWEGFERFVELAPALRERLSEATGKPAAFTWFLRMDPQVAGGWGSPTWAAERYEALFAEVTEQGDELGVHTHTWRWDSQADDWVAYYDDPAWAEHCLTMGLDAFEEAFGRSCAAHRSGDHFLNGAMLSVLESRGVKIDLTVEPGLPPLGANESETDHGLCPDYRGTPAKPYRSSPDRFPDADPTSRANPLLVPLLSAPGRRPPFRRSPLYPWDEEGLKSFGQRLAAELLRKPPIIAAAVRSDAAIAPPPHWAKVTEYLEHLAGYRQMEFTTASKAADRLDD